jgi:Tfp pilus assembly protein PilX
MITRTQNRRGVQGSALIVVLVFLVILMGLAGAFFGRLHQVLAHQHRTERDTVCLHLAEAAAEHALARVLTENRANLEIPETALGSGFYSAQSESLDDGRTIEIQAWGCLMANGRIYHERALRITATRSAAGGLTSLRWEEAHHARR